MDIYQQLAAQVKATNPTRNMTLGEVCDLDQDLAYLQEIHSLLLNPNSGLNLIVTSQKVFSIASRWLGGSESLVNWMQAYMNVNGF